MALTDLQAFINLAAQRRSVYTIDDQDPSFSAGQIESVVRQALDICPSPWNIKSSCCVILTGKNNKKLHNDIILPAMRNALPAEAFQAMEGKLEGCAAGLGTVLFFESQDIWDELVRSSPRSKPMAEPWSNVVSGMIQYTVWTALSVAGFGCNLQHFDWNETVVQKIQSQFDVPKSWRLKAELVFGHKYEEPGPIPHQALATIYQRLKVFS